MAATRAKPRQAARLAPDDRKAAILGAAREVLRQVGYENFAPAEVAARCGVSEATVYRYFPTKRDLLIRVAEEWFEEVLAREPAAAPSPDPYGQLRQLIAYSLSIVRQEPAVTRFVLLVLRSDVDYRSPSIYRLNKRFTSAVTRIVENSIGSGLFRSDVNPTVVRDMVFGAIEHRSWSYLRGSDFAIDEAADAIAGIIFRGMLAPAEARHPQDGEIRRLVGGLVDQATGLQDDIGRLRELLGGEGNEHC